MNNNLYNQAYTFAIRVIKGCQFLSKEKREFVLSKQFLKSGTSIGANVAEANGAISKADFSSKIFITYKESLETKYWFSLFRDTDFIDSKTFKCRYDDVDELSKIL